MKKPPIDPMNYVSGVNVVDIGDARVARGRSRREYSRCPHIHLNYDHSERRIYCSDCESDIEAFDAFLVLVEAFDKGTKRLKAERESLEEARNYHIISLAAKHVDKVWLSRKMAPCCPHCKRGLLPEDFKSGVPMQVGRMMELHRRKLEEDRDQ